MGFGMFRIIWNAFDRAHFHTLGCIKMPHTLGALQRVDFIKLDTRINCLVRAFRFADIAVDALIGDLESQIPDPFLQTGAAWPAGHLR